MGGGRGTLARMVLAEALSVGIVGGVLGLIIGAGLQYLSTLILGASIGIPVAYTAGWSVLLYGLVALGLSLLGGHWPAAPGNGCGCPARTPWSPWPGPPAAASRRCSTP